MRVLHGGQSDTSVVQTGRNSLTYCILPFVCCANPTACRSVCSLPPCPATTEPSLRASAGWATRRRRRLRGSMRAAMAMRRSTCATLSVTKNERAACEA